jgi:Cytochrome c oxidase subunit IV
MPEEQAQGQQIIEKVETIEKVEQMQESQEPRELEKKKVVRPLRATPEQAFSPGASRSYWPFALALVVSIALMGVVVYPIVFFIGMVLTVVIIIAWGIERK